MASIMIFGDICPDNDYRALFDSGQYGPFDNEIVCDINNSSFVIGNLECPATENRIPIVKCGPTLRAEPKDIELLSRLGFSILSLANNHILDYGILSAEETIQKCESCGIMTVGAGRNMEQASESLIVDADGKKVGILSFAEAEFNLATETAPGANHFDPYTSYDDVSSLKKQTDFIIILYHGGIEHYQYPSPLLQKKCRGFIKAGANLVLCQHSHCIGTEEKYENGTILYGQGNSVFGYREGNKTWNEGIVVKVDLSSQEISYKLLEADKNGIHYAEDDKSTERIVQLKKESVVVKDSAEIKFRWMKYCASQAPLDMPLLYGRNRVYIKLNRILRNKLIDHIYSRKKQRITMNLLRCESHHEVIQTILENKTFN